MKQRGTDAREIPTLIDGDYVPSIIKSIIPVSSSESEDGIEEVEFVLIPGERAMQYYGTDLDERDEFGYFHFRVPKVEVDLGNPDPAYATWACLRNLKKGKGVMWKRWGKIIDQNKELQKENNTIRLRVANLQKELKKQSQENKLDKEFLSVMEKFIYGAVNAAMKSGAKS